MRFLAQEVREWMALLGVRDFNDLVGHVELLRVKYKIYSEKAKTVELSGLLFQPSSVESGEERYFHYPQKHMLQRSLDKNTLLPLCLPALAVSKGAAKITSRLRIENANRTVGSMLSGDITREFGIEGLPDDTVRLVFDGSAGQSFGAFLAPGITLELHGEANDHVGKGLSGGRIVVMPPDGTDFDSQVIIGNVALYGATSGEAYIRGIAGERFCVRNSGATAVVEGVGDHGCEYMTGGVAAVLGPTGKNFAAGMSGGAAYVFDPEDKLEENSNLGLVILTNLDEEDAVILKDLLERHRTYTGSPKAEALLGDFDSNLAAFVKVIPYAYRKIPAESAEQQASQTAILISDKEAPIEIPTEAQAETEALIFASPGKKKSGKRGRKAVPVVEFTRD
jgi:glutamate synthase (ferredoxin)